MKLSIRRKYTLSERFRREAVFFGVPVLFLELMGIAMVGWGPVVMLAVPVTLAALLVATTIEHFLISALAKRNLP